MSSDGEQRRPADLWQNMVSKDMELQANDEAWAICQRELSERPESPELLVSAAAVLMRLDRAAEAEQYVARAVALQPNSPILWNNLGLALRNQNRIADSLRCFDKALALDPDWPRAHYDRAFALLLAGDYEQGFREYEHRWQANGTQRPGDDEPDMRKRLWGGQTVANKRILLYAEQGFGDTIQFVRYVAPLQARGAEVVLEVQPALRGLMRWLRPECEVGNGNVSAEFDLHCPMMTLPLAFKTTRETIPRPAAFEIPEAVQAKWQAKIASGNRLKVGLVWAGSPENPMDDRRSTHLGTFEPLLSDPILREKATVLQFSGRGARGGTR